MKKIFNFVLAIGILFLIIFNSITEFVGNLQNLKNNVDVYNSLIISSIAVVLYVIFNIKKIKKEMKYF